MLGDSADFLVAVATTVLVTSCKATVGILLVLACRKLLATHLSGPARHWLWMAVLVCTLLPVGFPLQLQAPAAIASRQFVIPIEATASRSATVATALDPSTAAQPIASPSIATPGPRASGRAALPSREMGAPVHRMPLRSWLALSWAAGVVVLAIVLLWNLHRFRRIAVEASMVEGPARELMQECMAVAGVCRAVRLLESPRIPSPAVMGWRSPMVLLPIGLQQRLDPAQLRHVLLHELAHVRRHDILANWVATGAQVLHWFNPLVWYGLRVMRADMEQACDALVLSHLAPAEHSGYGHTLIGVMDAFPGRVPAQALGVVESRAQIRERITMIAKFSSRMRGSKIPAAALMLALASIAATQPRMVASAPASRNAGRVHGPSGVGSMLKAQAAGPPSAPAQPAPASRDDSTPIVAPPPATPRTPALQPIAQPGGVNQAVAGIAAPFTVRLMPLGITAAGGTIVCGSTGVSSCAGSERRPSAGVIASLHSQYVALASKLRAVPGLRLITPESAGSGGAVINYQVDFKVEVMDDDRQLVNISARTLSRPSGNDAGVQPGPDGVQAARSGAIQSFAQWGTQGFNGQRPAPERDLDRFIDAARVSIFPTSPSFQQDLLARLRDSRVDSSERWVALNNLLQSGGLVGAPLDPAIISAGIDYASSEVDPELRASIWEQLANSGAPAIVTPLVRALVAERDEKSRIHLMQVLARNHGADPQARAALESIARVEDHQLTRMIAQHLLAGGTAWNEYLLSTLKNEQLPDAQRIEPLSYAGFSPQSLLGEPVLDEQAIRMLGGILSRMKSGSDGARIANLLGRIRSQVALDVIIDIVRPAEGHPQALREIRSMVLAQLGDLIRARYDARARTFAEEVAAHDDDPEIRDVARKMLESVSR